MFERGDSAEKRLCFLKVQLVLKLLFLYTFCMSKQTINIKDIAEITGLSTATISRVMNHPEKVRLDTREKVLAAMEQSGYLPNHLARGLISGKTHTIALLVPDIEHTTYQMILSGVETISIDKHYNVFLCNTHSDPVIEYEYIKMAVNKGVDGIILSNSSLRYNQTKILDDNSIPFIHIGKKTLLGCSNRCYIDHSRDAQKVTEHLKSMGHKEIVLVLNDESEETRGQLIEGYAQALGKDPASLKDHIYSCANSLEGGFYIASKLIDENRLGRAILTATDLQAFGILKAAQKNNVRIPNDLALACMNDSSVCALVSPPLTCIAAPSKRLGMVAARMLFDSIADRNLESIELQDVILQSTLKIRQSCGNTKNIYESFE
ncbi:MAG: LacI family transcriptional regulator [Firmicutes bacterium]|nr:LacI family transcriptional regulator [Bacillota bacterium]